MGNNNEGNMWGNEKRHVHLVMHAAIFLGAAG